MTEVVRDLAFYAAGTVACIVIIVMEIRDRVRYRRWRKRWYGDD